MSYGEVRWVMTRYPSCASVKPTLTLRAACFSPWLRDVPSIPPLWHRSRLVRVSVHFPGSPTVPWSPNDRGCFPHPRFPGKEGFYDNVLSKMAPIQNLAWYISKVFWKKKKYVSMFLTTISVQWLKRPYENLESQNGEHLVWILGTLCLFNVCALPPLLLLAGGGLWIPAPCPVT